jgi:hypothetical protein
LQQLSIINNSLIVLFALFITFCSANLGFFFLKFLKITKSDNEETRIFILFYSICTGFILIVLLLYILAAFKGINKFSIWGILILQIIILVFNKDFFIHLKDLFKILIRKLKDLLALKNNWFIITAILVVIFFIIAGLLISTIPTMEVDSTTTYLNAAKLFLKYNSVVDVGNIIGNDTKNGYLLITYGLGLGSGILSQILLFILSFTGILYFYVFLTKRTNIFISSIITLIFVIMRHQTDIVIKTAKLDGINFTFSVFVLITFVSILLNKDNEPLKRKYIYLNGVSLGFLAGIRYFNLCIPFIILLLFIIFFNKGNIKGKIIKFISWFSITSFFALPGFLFNVYNFKNPVYPFFGNIFRNASDKNISSGSWVFNNIHFNGGQFSSGPGIKNALLLPLTLFTDSVKLNSSTETVFSIFWIIITLLIPIILLLILFFKRKIFKEEVFKIFIISLIGYIFIYVFWSKTSIILRYLTVGFPYLFLLAAAMFKILIELLDNKVLRKFKIIFPIFLVCFCVIVYVNLYPLNDSFKKNAWRILHKQTVDNIISSEFTYKEDNGNIANFGAGIIELKRMVKKGDKVLSFVPAVYYMGDNAIVFLGYGLSLPSKFGLTKTLNEYKDQNEFKNDLKLKGFTYVVLNPNYLPTFNNDEKVLIKDFVENEEPFKTINDILIYKL